MSNKTQTKKNIELTGKLIKFMINQKGVSDLPEDVSIVPFSKKDKKLNEANQKLLESIYQEGKPVAIAQEPKSKKQSWNIIPANF